jgi:hypothetical protein
MGQLGHSHHMPHNMLLIFIIIIYSNKLHDDSIKDKVLFAQYNRTEAKQDTRI